MNEITLEYLRSEIESTKFALAFIKNTKLGELSDFDIASYYMTQGELFTYERIIKHMRNLSEREFQLAKKKGTL
jgi:hypothetical protein